MDVIRLPLSGDWVQSRLIVGVSADGNDDLGDGAVTVWTAGKSASLHILQEIYTASLTHAREVRDAIVKAARLEYTPLPNGDVINPAFVCGVCAQGSDSEGGLVTVWVTDILQEEVHSFTTIDTETVDDALACRDLISQSTGMAAVADTSAYDEEAALNAGECADVPPGGDGSAVMAADRAAPDTETATAAPRHRPPQTRSEHEMLEMLQWWQPENPAN